MPTHPKITIFCYLTSEFLDALDGHAARALGQSKFRIFNTKKSLEEENLGTKFGAMFDMLVDRCSTMCLCFVLAMFYPKWALFFQLWAAIDVASHWLHLHA
jgi:CDP-diacylglycerol--inositol 3-phosphatidyltransferase